MTIEEANIMISNIVHSKVTAKPQVRQVQRPMLSEWSITQKPINTIARNNETGILKDEQ